MQSSIDTFAIQRYEMHFPLARNKEKNGLEKHSTLCKQMNDCLKMVLRGMVYEDVGSADLSERRNQGINFASSS